MLTHTHTYTASFQVADALEMPFADSSFDLVWSLESGEHMPDKSKFVGELTRVAKPGATIILCTWVHRDLEEGEELTRKEQRLLAKINRAYYLPPWCSSKDYQKLLAESPSVDMKTLKVRHRARSDDFERLASYAVHEPLLIQSTQVDDWSYVIAPFWKAVIKSSLNARSVLGLLKSGFSTMRGAWAMFLMLRGFNVGLIKFGVISVKKSDN